MKNIDKIAQEMTAYFEFQRTCAPGPTSAGTMTKEISGINFIFSDPTVNRIIDLSKQDGVVDK